MKITLYVHIYFIQKILLKTNVMPFSSYMVIRYQKLQIMFIVTNMISHSMLNSFINIDQEDIIIGT